jgi:hypothetical protein
MQTNLNYYLIKGVSKSTIVYFSVIVMEFIDDDEDKGDGNYFNIDELNH